MTWPAVLLWIAMLAAAVSDGPALIYLFGLTGAIGTLQMLPAGAAGNLVPQAVCAGLLVLKIFARPGNGARGLAAAIDPRRVGLLVAFLVYGLATAVVLPRLFAGRIELFSVTGILSGTSLVQPSTGNITQCCYMTLSVATAVAFAIVGSRLDFRRHFLMATLIGGVVVVATGVADMATYTFGGGELLEPFRTVSYSLLTDTETLGAKRVVGLMSEASSYGSLCVATLSLLTFLRPCFSPRLRRAVVPPTIGGLILMAGLSTSSSAYVGLGVFAAVFALNWLSRLMNRVALAPENLRSEFVVVVMAGFGLLCFYALAPERFAPAFAMVDSAIFEKTSSASFIERGTWTAFGWSAFLETGGLGVGLGSLRVSNWLVSILGSTGVFGAALMFGFVIWSLVPSGRPLSAQDREWQSGLRLSLLPLLAMIYLIGTMPDIGPFVAALFGLLAAARPAPWRRPLFTPLQARPA